MPKYSSLTFSRSEYMLISCWAMSTSALALILARLAAIMPPSQSTWDNSRTAAYWSLLKVGISIP